MKKYTKEHEWVAKSGDVYRIGITDYAQQQLGDVVAVEFPEVGLPVRAGDECCVIESVKAASDVYAPASGEITATNDALMDDPARINDSPEEDGWLWEMKIGDESVLSTMMDAGEYQKFTAQSE